MSRAPLVSVVTIFFNSEKFIQEAIESVLAQTYDNWEFLLVDDGSIDGSREIALQYAQEYPRNVRYLEHPGHRNRGMSASRNLGIRNAKGEYLAFLDSDDVWLPHKLEQQISLLHSQPEIGMIYEAAQFWSSWTKNPEDFHKDFVQEFGASNVVINPPRLLLTLLSSGEACMPCTCSMLLRRSVVDCVGGFEEAFRGMCEDLAFCVKVGIKAPVFVSSGFLSRRRVHPESCLFDAIRKGQYHLARLEFLEWVARYLSEHQVKDTAVWRVLEMELWPYRHPALTCALGDLSHLLIKVLPKEVRGFLRLALFDRLGLPPSVARDFRKVGGFPQMLPNWQNWLSAPVKRNPGMSTEGNRAQPRDEGHKCQEVDFEVARRVEQDG
jgi:glycosyltransferase involved in cell wall biosynthesis